MLKLAGRKASNTHSEVIDENSEEDLECASKASSYINTTNKESQSKLFRRQLSVPGSDKSSYKSNALAW